MTSLYTLRSTHSPGEYTITKLTPDLSVESLYALSPSTCTCPQGFKPKCKHRRMLPLFLEHSHVDDGWFLDWDTRMWRHPIGENEFLAEASLADASLLGDAEHAEEIAARLAPALESAGSALVLSEQRERLPLSAKSEAMGVEGRGETAPAGEARTLASAGRPSPAPGEIKRRKLT